MTARLSPNLAGIRCFACETSHDPLQLLTVCRACGLPLRVDYNLSSLKLSLRDLQSREPSLWRYRELLPLLPGDEVSLVEGLTPLLPVETNVWVKDESRNPTGSFKARGMALAVSMAKHHEEADAATQQLGSRTGIDVCPEGGAAWSALQTLRTSGFTRDQDRVVVFNTGTGLKYR